MRADGVRTPRLTLIPSTLEVAEAVILDRARAEGILGARLHPEWPGRDTRDFLPLYINRLRDDPGFLGWGLWLMILEEGAHVLRQVVIGDLGYKGQPDAEGAVDIGYAVVSSERNKGYATEAVRALIGWAFGHLSVRVVTAGCLRDNLASARVLEKAGMRRAGSSGVLLKWRFTRADWEKRTRALDRATQDHGISGVIARGLHYVEQGSGCPVILIHGLGCSSVQWMYTLPALESAGFRAIAVDLPGFGRSYLPDAPITTGRYSADVLRFLDDMRISEAILIGNSMGGFVSWYAAALAPDRVKALVLSNSGGAPLAARDGQADHRLRRTRGQPAGAHAAARGAGRRPLGMSQSHARNFLFRAIIGLRVSEPLTRRLVRPVIDLAYGDVSRITPEVFEALHQAARQARIVYAGRLRWQPPKEDPAELLERLRCPVLVVWGDKDRVIPVEAMDYFKAHLPHASGEVFHGAGHLPMLELPEQFNAAVLAFLARVAPETGTGGRDGIDLDLRSR